MVTKKIVLDLVIELFFFLNKITAKEISIHMIILSKSPFVAFKIGNLLTLYPDLLIFDTKLNEFLLEMKQNNTIFIDLYKGTHSLNLCKHMKTNFWKCRQNGVKNHCDCITFTFKLKLKILNVLWTYIWIVILVGVRKIDHKS